MNEYNDYPIDECLESAGELIEQGCDIHQKWTCQHCGSRQAMGEANKFFRSGKCEDCGKVTVISKCNYLVIF